VERWLNDEFENPAAPIIKKVLNDEALSQDERQVLIRFVGIQAGRTVASYIKIKHRSRLNSQAILDRVLESAVHKAERLSKKGRKLPTTRPTTPFPIEVRTQESDGENQASITATFIAGREYFLWVLRQILPRLLPVLTRHQWTILHPARGLEWPTSDNPFIALNYTRPGKYDLEGGWGRKNGDLLFPLGPRHILHAYIGHSHRPPRSIASREKTFELQRIICENAHRWIYARADLRCVPWFRPSHIDAVAFQQELADIRKWHREQRAPHVRVPEEK
jgi:hypothetical protein